MSSVYKTFAPEDITNSKTLLYENIPITGSILSGTYGESNILKYTHGMFQTIHDYPYASSSANNLFDLTLGYNSASPAYGTNSSYNTKKSNIYYQLAKVLVGHDQTGSIYKFDEDGNYASSNDKINEAFFLTFSRILVKDEIKKGSFSMIVGAGNAGRDSVFSSVFSIVDASGTTSYNTNSPVGEYGILYADGAALDSGQTDKKVGLIFYQAGVAVINSNIFTKYSAGTSPSGSITGLSGSYRGQLTAAAEMYNTTGTFGYLGKALVSGSINDVGDALRTRIENINFQNTTELNSTIYFVRVNNNEFNYSSNPTYLSGSQIIVKGGDRTASPVTYITTAGLYSPDNELLAVAKLSEPIKKTADQSLLLRVRLDY